MLRLIFEHENPEVLSFWQQQFKDFSEVIFKQTYKESFDLYKIDAQLQRFIFPCDRYGLFIEPEECWVIGAKYVREYNELTPWIVTTPRLDNPDLSSPERDYLEFKLAFEAIDEHNQLDPQTPINTLFINIKFLYGFRNHIPFNEAIGACKAYRDYKEKQMSM